MSSDSDRDIQPRDAIFVYHTVPLEEGEIRLRMEEWRDDPDPTFELEDGITPIRSDERYPESVMFHLREIPILIQALQDFAQKVRADLEREPPLRKEPHA